MNKLDAVPVGVSDRSAEVPVPSSGSLGPVVFCDVGGSIERIRARFPGLDIVDISDGVPASARGHVLFGGLGQRSVDAMTAGVQWVHAAGTGIDGLAPEIRGAPILTVSRGASAVAISEYVITVMGAFARNLPDNWLRAAPERWYHQRAAPLAGSSLGLIGLGGIGQRVARVALALEMSVFAVRHHRAPSPVAGVELVGSPRELFSLADHLVLAAPLTDATRHVVNAAHLSAMRPGAHLVNVARGGLVDQEALRGALDDGTVARASLDVTDPEPLPDGHWLYTHPRVYLTPHASWIGPPPLQTATDLFCDNLARFLAGEPLHGIVGPDGY